MLQAVFAPSGEFSPVSQTPAIAPREPLDSRWRDHLEPACGPSAQKAADRPDRACGPRRRRWTAHLPRVRRSAALFRLDLPKVLSLSQRAQHGRPIGSQAMDMWTTQERCPHAHSLNNKYKSQTKVESAKDHCPQILRRRQIIEDEFAMAEQGLGDFLPR